MTAVHRIECDSCGSWRSVAIPSERAWIELFIVEVDGLDPDTHYDPVAHVCRGCFEGPAGGVNQDDRNERLGSVLLGALRKREIERSEAAAASRAAVLRRRK